MPDPNGCAPQFVGLVLPAAPADPERPEVPPAAGDAPEPEVPPRFDWLPPTPSGSTPLPPRPLPVATPPASWRRDSPPQPSPTSATSHQPLPIGGATALATGRGCHPSTRPVEFGLRRGTESLDLGATDVSEPFHVGAEIHAASSEGRHWSRSSFRLSAQSRRYMLMRVWYGMPTRSPRLLKYASVGS